jgi:hypothetical protein
VLCRGECLKVVALKAASSSPVDNLQNLVSFAGAAAVGQRSATVLLFVRFLCLCESFGSASCLPTIAFTCSVDERSQHCKAVEVVGTSNGCLLT